ncbi:hypothetical protein AB1Y20_006878 [Prymnesium parvum]|uniref:Uncharacterized protein n=1 Tax=Prymnesium parvum TaxID=97485 RepID=A0AB34J320_PRYPA
MLLLLLLLTPPAESGRRKRRKRRRAWWPSVSTSSCCAALSSGCRDCCRPPAALASTRSPPADGTADSCVSQPSRVQCEASSPVEPGRGVCVWVGGRCSRGTWRDCAEPPPRLNWYGEEDAFEERCAGEACPGFVRSFSSYAWKHNAATRNAQAPEGNERARVLVIRDYWKNVGMGFMPEHVASVLRFAIQTGIYIYFENYGRYDWTRYFYGYMGLDVRWTTARRSAWERKFASVGGCVRREVEVWHEDGSRIGDEEWEQTVTHLLSNTSVQFIEVHGQATTFNYNRVLAPALRGAARGRESHADPLGTCTPCAMWAMYRPRPALARELLGTPVVAAAPLVCLKGRTMYAEDKRFLPDSTPPDLASIDRLWTTYSDALQMGDETYWGPRPRLRCKGRLVPPGEALRCLTKVRSSLGAHARLFVAVDAPRLQQAVSEYAREQVFVTPGVGVDPTNEFRDTKQATLKEQGIGKQELTERNLIKVSLDYYIQGFCLASLTLRPSAFYNAARRRTSAILPSIWRHILRNTSYQQSSARSKHHNCALGGMECVHQICGLKECNNFQ